MDSGRTVNGVKNFLLVRWRKRWPMLPLGAALALICAWHSMATKHYVNNYDCVRMPVLFIVGYILFPFRWRGEHFDNDRPFR